jgi:hypothetical protein
MEESLPWNLISPSINNQPANYLIPFERGYFMGDVGVENTVCFLRAKGDVFIQYLRTINSTKFTIIYFYI